VAGKAARAKPAGVTRYGSPVTSARESRRASASDTTGGEATLPAAAIDGHEAAASAVPRDADKCAVGAAVQAPSQSQRATAARGQKKADTRGEHMPAR